AAAVASGTDIVPSDLQSDCSALNRLPEIDIQRVFQVRALFGGLGFRLRAAAEELREDVAETAAGLVFGPATALLTEEFGEVEAAEVHIGFRTGTAGTGAGTRARITVRRVESELIVHLPLLGVAQNVVGFLYLAETFFSRFVARVQIG